MEADSDVRRQWTISTSWKNRSVHILREAYATSRTWDAVVHREDSTVLLWLARKAFFGQRPRFPHSHRTSFKIRDDRVPGPAALEWNLTMIYGQNRQALEEKRTFPDGAVDRNRVLQGAEDRRAQAHLSGEWPR